jgi:choline dehydrogenase-like flavoprotein
VTRYDVIIIGTGAGGGTMARALAETPARILVLERGIEVPTEAENWSPEAVWKHLRYRTTERWLDASGAEFLPYTHYAVGGNTKFWGSVLYRLRREDFEAVEHADGLSPAWPIGYTTLEPFYERAEQLYHVHGQRGGDPTDPARGPFPHAPVPHSPQMAALVEAFGRQGLHPSYLPLGLIRPGEPDGCLLCNTCNSFPCRIHAKSDAVCGVERPRARGRALDECACRSTDHRCGGRKIAVEVQRGDGPSGLPICVVSWAPSIGRAAAGSASGNTSRSRIVRAGRQALHGSSRPMMEGST